MPVLRPNATLADYELLLPDSRVERLRGMLEKEFPRLPAEFQLATYIQPGGAHPDPRTHQIRILPTYGVFLLVSDNPHPRHKGEVLKTGYAVEMKAWREEEEASWRFVGAGDPALKFFRSAARQHLAALKNWREMN